VQPGLVHSERPQCHRGSTKSGTVNAARPFLLNLRRGFLRDFSSASCSSQHSRRYSMVSVGWPSDCFEPSTESPVLSRRSNCFSILNTISQARRSPLPALLTTCFTINALLVRFLRPPYSVIETRASNSSPNRVAVFLDPGGRPFGLPDWPFRNLLWRGGSQRPTDSPGRLDQRSAWPASTSCAASLKVFPLAAWRAG
jgi:hypothetical protein